MEKVERRPGGSGFGEETVKAGVVGQIVGGAEAGVEDGRLGSAVGVVGSDREDEKSEDDAIFASKNTCNVGKFSGE